MAFLRGSLAALILLGLGLVTGCVTDSATSGNPNIPTATTTAQLRPGDSLTIALQGVPDPSTNAVTIDDKGAITLPYIGPLSAAGLTTAELSQSIRQTYVAKKIYTVVDVSVSVTERFIYVDGEVQRPGRIVWTPDLTVSKAIQSAGGFSLYAKETGVRLVRDNNSYVVDVKLAQRNPSQDPKLVPGDSLHVARSPF